MRASLDLSCGASGDMLLGALVDAGADLDEVQAAVAALNVPVSITSRRVSKGGVAARKVDVTPGESDPPHRTWFDIKALLDEALLEEPVRQRAQEVFAVLADAEALAHNIPATAVHFHEVGAHDAIADVVGVCAAVSLLGITHVTAGPVALGGGTVRAAHGVMDVPVPAVREIVALHDLRVLHGPVDVELCTPTGAALLAVLVDEWVGAPDLAAAARVGVGAGTRDLPDRANVLRVALAP